MSSIQVGKVNFRVYPQDHEPRHVHGIIGSGEVIVDLRADGTVDLADRKNAVVGVTNSEVRKVLIAAEEKFDELAELWKVMHQ